MTVHSPLTVKDILLRKHFDKAEVIAGIDGLNRTVKWVHVVEILKIKNLLKGNELILSTGVGWTHNHDLLSFIEELIDSNASGLCIEIGIYTSSIPQEAINLANKHHFPIIIFHEEVPFVEITQDIHSFITNQQYQIISNLESYSQQLNKDILTVSSYKQILIMMQNYLGVQVIFQFYKKDPEFYPNVSSKKKEQLLKNIAKENSKHIRRQSIQMFGNQYAEIIICSMERTISEFDLLILDRTVTALTQYLLRDLYIEEKRKVEESKWLENWLEGRHTAETILHFIKYHDAEYTPSGGTVLVISYRSKKIKEQLDLTYFKLLCRTIFEQQGFLVFVTEKKDYLIFILVNKQSNSNWKPRIETGINRLKQSKFLQKEKNLDLVFGVGKFVNELNQISKSYQTARETSYIQHKSKSISCFCEDIRLLWLIMHLQKRTNLEEIIYEIIGPIIEHDKKYNGKLLETLKEYLASNCSKQETANKLFVVRQTLYHRLEKIECLIGKDFMKPEKRLTIEFMIRTYEFLFQK